MKTATAALENFKKLSPKNLPLDEPLSKGHRACQGCGEVLALRMIAKAVGKELIAVSATGCMEIISSPYPQTAWECPWIHVAFENAASVASGVEAGRKALIRKGRIKDDGAKIMAFAGDGGTADIGIQALSGAIERGHNFTYVCLDNEAYMNTGVQRSSSTPYGAMTTTSPPGAKSKGQFSWKKNMPMIAAAHDMPYVATASPAFHMDLMNKVRKAVTVPGPAYLHVFAPCPTGWRCAPDISVETARQVVQARIFPLYEVIDGRYVLNRDVKKPLPVKEYMKKQKRFAHLTDEDFAYIQEKVDADWNRLKALVKATNPED
ncbi:thiamine pyrophosphate-dependent enzyme [Dethiosulfatarculus sandiegensis]|uniref:Pyruvate ferredoxin oxidoreductase subunit beta n=1 Tax=Dethiosulfatarculus sandiegensis TaxID=1429043 RepID=A0A0D2J7N5_9BACT|nr:thiamine pyrophosphate-dependent enzyme [Dethiosulfatarculus sandiegensis]KIX14224.1 pyruvate ferredoxin oxidoreductase subunit beta [Dethiosulfatarculus sandiegensis]